VFIELAEKAILEVKNEKSINTQLLDAKKTKNIYLFFLRAHP
jgi:hypothetical protein